MFTGPEGPVEVFLTDPKPFWEFFLLAWGHRTTVSFEPRLFRNKNIYNNNNNNKNNTNDNSNDNNNKNDNNNDNNNNNDIKENNNK